LLSHQLSLGLRLATITAIASTAAAAAAAAAATAAATAAAAPQKRGTKQIALSAAPRRSRYPVGLGGRRLLDG
jgi:hypothetical protein